MMWRANVSAIVTVVVSGTGAPLSGEEQTRGKQREGDAALYRSGGCLGNGDSGLRANGGQGAIPTQRAVNRKSHSPSTLWEQAHFCVYVHACPTVCPTTPCPALMNASALLIKLLCGSVL